MSPAFRSSPRTAIVALMLVPAGLIGQQTASRPKLDRDAVPTPAAAPVLHAPKWTTTKLANGAELVVIQKRDLPLVSLTINFVGGSANFEPTGKIGVASMTAAMLSEGTTSRSGEQISDAQQLLGTAISANVGGESGSIGFTALADKLQPSLELLADLLLHPSFPNEALERLRGRTLVSLAQAKDEPNTIASNVFSKVVYGEAHPYGRVMTEESARAITRDDIAQFHAAYFKPGRAVISVAGDVDPAAVRAIVEKTLASWQSGGARPSFDYPAPPALKPRTIYLVDKPQAAQSVFALGIPGPGRDTPDYYAIQVMNNILGVLFQSRLNHNIREEKGYSYGVSSGFAFGRGPGAFRAGGGIVTAKTDSALIEFMKELNGVRGAIPFTDDEIEQGKASLIQSLPRRFSSVNGIGGSVASLYVQGLPESYFQEYASKINAITRDDLVRVAKTYVDVDHLDIVIVGDRATIEEALRKTGIAPVIVVDANARPITVP